MDRLFELQGEFWTAAVETLYMVGLTLLIGGTAGLLLGVVLYTTRPGSLLSNGAIYNVVNVVINFFRPIPFIIFIAAVQPLSRLVCVAPRMTEASLAPLLPILASELNVKRVEVATSADALVTLEAKANYRALGKKFGKQTPLAAEAVSQFTSEHLRRFEQGEELSVTVDGDTHVITPEDLTIVRRASGALVVQEEHGYFAAIDPAMTRELRQEGMARELISRVQRMRKDAGLAVSDRIRLVIRGDAEAVEAATTHREWIASEVLATDVRLGDAREGEGTTLARQRVDLDGIRADLALTKDE